MGRNLGPLNIKDSYEGLVQISGSNRDTLTDGSGSVITNLNVTSSFATTASYAENVVPTPTGSFMVTGSVVDATLTFTKGDASTFPLTVDNVANAVSASYALTASFAENTTTPTLQEVTDEGNTTTNSVTVEAFVFNRGTFVGSAPLGSGPYTKLLTQGIQAGDSGGNFMIDGGTTTTSKLILSATSNSSTFPTAGSTLGSIKIDAATSTIQVTGSLRAPSITGSLNGNADTATSASHAVSSDTSISASHALNADNAISASHAIFADTAGFATDVNALYTASVVDDTITFLKGGGGTFPIRINNVGNAISASHALNADNAISSSYAVTASYVEGAGVAFPFTGSAEITGSLGLTGSLSQGDTNSNLGTNTAILSSGHSLISASVLDSAIISSTGSYQSTTQPGRTAIIASDNSYINSTSAGNNDDIALIGTLNSRFTGGGARQAVIAGTNDAYNNGSRFSFIGGGERHIMEGYYANAMVGGTSNRMIRGTNSAIAGGGGNRVGNTTQTDYGFVGGGSNNFLDGQNGAIIAGTGNDNNQLRAVILGGESNTINGGQGGIVAGGINNVVGHDRSVVLGGSALSTTKADEVVVEHLSTNGAVVQDVKALSIVANIAELDASLGNMFTLTLQNAQSTELQLTNQSAGQTFQVQVTQNATNAGDMTFDSQFEFEGGTAFVPSSGLGAIDILTFTCFGGGNVQCVSAKNFS